MQPALAPTVVLCLLVMNTMKAVPPETTDKMPITPNADRSTRMLTAHERVVVAGAGAVADEVDARTTQTTDNIHTRDTGEEEGTDKAVVMPRPPCHVGLVAVQWHHAAGVAEEEVGDLILGSVV